MAGLMKRRKKNPPIKEQSANSVTSGYFRCRLRKYFSFYEEKLLFRSHSGFSSWLTRVKLRICLQIHLIPYGTISRLAIIVSRKSERPRCWLRSLARHLAGGLLGFGPLDPAGSSFVRRPDKGCSL
jgi:hypothetical protein